MAKVYIASKFAHGARWKQLRDDAWQWEHLWAGVEFTSRWFTYYHENVPDEPEFCKIGWIHDLEDVAAADALIVYAEPDEHLRGALVEAGAALALGKHVILVGDHPDYGTWQYHPLVHKVPDLDSAVVILRCLDTGKDR